MILVLRISRWFRFKLWLAIKLMTLANRLIKIKHQNVAPQEEPLTLDQKIQLAAEIQDHPLH